MHLRQIKIRYGHIPAHHSEMSAILFALLLVLFSSFVPDRVEACCYPGCAYNGNFSGVCCSTVEECEAPAQNGCTIEIAYYPSGDVVYWRHCSGTGGTSQCMVLPDIDCCAFGSTSKCCIGGKTDPCCGNPDPCCADPVCCGDPCCGSQCCPADNPGQAGA
jgi:hypothetical protein